MFYGTVSVSCKDRSKVGTSLEWLGPKRLNGQGHYYSICPDRGVCGSTLVFAVDFFSVQSVVNLILAHLGQSFFPNDPTKVSLYSEL